MSNTVKLSQHAPAVIQAAIDRNSPGNHISPEFINQAAQMLIQDNYRYSFKTGETRRNSFKNWYSQPVGEPEVYDNEEEAAIWEFVGSIRSEAWQIQEKQ